MMTSRDDQMIEINLNAPARSDDQELGNTGIISLGRGEKSMPVMDNNAVVADDQIIVEEQPLTPVEIDDDGISHLKFYAVGPRTHRICCPLCKNQTYTETVTMSGIFGRLSCVLSCLSCCFPIFSLSFVYLCLQSRLKSKRLFCNTCGGHLGFYWRPT